MLVDIRLDNNLCTLIEDASKSVFEDLRGRAFAKHLGSDPFGSHLAILLKCRDARQDQHTLA